MFFRNSIACATFIASLTITGEAMGCASYNAAQISQAIQNSPNANSTLKNASCQFGGAGVAESNGNSCSSNGNNFGVLQLTSTNLPANVTSSQYLAMPLQQQVNIWAQQVGNSNSSGGYQTLANANNSGGSIGGTPVTAGMMGACFQFGPLICKNDIAAMQQNGGQCPSASNGGVRATWATLADGTASMDGNNQSICSWGKSIQNKINRATATCSNPNAPVTPPTTPKKINCPTPSGAAPGTAIPPTPASAPVSLPANLA